MRPAEFPVIGEPIGTPTGWVVATDDVPATTRLWTDGFGYVVTEDTPSDLSELRHPRSGQAVTLVEFPGPDPPAAVAVRVSDIDLAMSRAESYGLTVHWTDSSSAGTSFVMCHDGRGVFTLLYQPATA